MDPTKNSTRLAAEKKILINRAYHYTKGIPNDSLKYGYLPKVASEYLKAKDSRSIKAEYYVIKKDTAQAILLIKEALQTNRNIQNHSESLKYLKGHMEQAWTLNYGMTAIAVLVIIVLTKIILYFYQSSKIKTLQLNNIKKHIEEKILQLENENFRDQQKERLRISNILHTEVLGSLSALRLKWFRNKLKGSNEQIREQLSDIDLLHKLEKTLRDLSQELYLNANSLELDFVNDITIKFKSRCDDARIAFQLITDGNIQWEIIMLPIKIKLYYIISESLNNCVKYAKAQHFTVVFYGIEPDLHFVIRDDGSGFIKSEITASLGLKLMHRNIEEIHGKIAFYPRPGIGTRIYGRIPIQT